MKPTTDQAHLIAPEANSDEARDLNSQRASSLLGLSWFKCGQDCWHAKFTSNTSACGKTFEPYCSRRETNPGTRPDRGEPLCHNCLEIVGDQQPTFAEAKAAATVRKWFPTGNLAWKQVPRYGDDGTVPVAMLYGATYELHQELFEIEMIGPAGDPDEAVRTGRIEWRPLPILPPDAPVSNCAEIIIPAFDSRLINAAESKS